MTNRPSYFFAIMLVLALAAGGTAGLLGSLFMHDTLEEYAAALFEGNRPATTPQTPRGGSDSNAESLARVNEVAEASLAIIASRTLDSRLAGSWITTDDALGVGAVVSTDGWVLVHTDVLSKRNPLRDIDVWIRGVRYEPTRYVSDTLTPFTLLKLEAANLAPVAFGASESVTSGTSVFALSGITQVETLTVENTRAFAADAVVPAEQYPYVWGLSSEIAVTSPVFTGEGDLLAIGEGTQAIPLHQGSAFVREVMRDGAPQHAGLGVYVVDVARTLNIDPTLTQGEADGFLITSPKNGEAPVLRGSPAEIAGLVAGDVILSIDDVPVDGSRSLAELLRLYDPGETAALRIVHQGVEKTVSVTFVDAVNLLY